MEHKSVEDSVAIIIDLVKDYELELVSNIFPITFQGREDLLSKMFEINGMNRMLFKYGCEYKLVSKDKNNGAFIYRLCYNELLFPNTSYYDFISNHIFEHEQEEIETIIDREHKRINRFNDCMDKLFTYDNLFDIQEDVNYFEDFIPMKLDYTQTVSQYILGNGSKIPESIRMVVFVYLIERHRNNITAALNKLINDDGKILESSN